MNEFLIFSIGLIFFLARHSNGRRTVDKQFAVNENLYYDEKYENWNRKI